MAVVVVLLGVLVALLILPRAVKLKALVARVLAKGWVVGRLVHVAVVLAIVGSGVPPVVQAHHLPEVLPGHERLGLGEATGPL